MPGKIKRVILLFTVYCSLFTASAFTEELNLQTLIDEALRNNHDVLMAESRWKSVTLRIPQMRSLPDPMLMIGYQNEGWRRYTYGEMEGAQWMFSASQIFPFPGKLTLKGEMAAKDSDALLMSYEAVKLKTISKVKELYYDLFFVHKSLDLINSKMELFLRLEDVAISRYSSGMALQQEVVMAQAEKYMLLERKEMLFQKKEGIEAMINSTIGRDAKSPLGIPQEPPKTIFNYSLDDLTKLAVENSPEIKSRQKMIEASDAKIKMAKKEYYPDLTLAASLFKRRGEFEDMWSLSTTINIPLFYKTKQRMAVLEALSNRSEVEHDLEGMKLMIASALRDNLSMINASEKLMELYRDALIPKTKQGFESALSGYIAGKIELITVIKNLTSLIDYETSYWNQFAEREKAIARIEVITGKGSGVRGQE
ncbi:MAG: TolC family protein [Nitrospirae bacterium]|nr:TolC family protein [Nitrospirota bacterium]